MNKLLLLPALLLASESSLSAAPRPNIVLIMVDDMGYSDIGCYGGEIRTPNVDKLAASGLRFTQFYNTARCCPTRASLLTGLYPHQAGVGWMMSDLGYDGYRGDLNKQCVTIAEVLKGAGYSTYMAGKWHVTKHTGPDGPKHNWPRQRGFDRFFGTITGAGSFYTPSTLTRENTRITEYPEGFFYTDAINDTTASYIREHARSNGDKPFFCYVAHTAPHWPLHAPKEDVDRYRDRYMKGWDALRKERHARMIEMGIVKKSWPLTERDRAAKIWEELDDEKKREMSLRMAVYAAQIDRVDQGIGRIVAALKETGKLDNTLIFFLADNGGCAEGGPLGFERKKGGVIGENSSFASYGLSWANASNTPFREYKHWVHEGGISTPLIVHWPRGIQSRGEFRRQPGHLIDIMATCIEVSGATYPEEVGGHKIKPFEGKSLVPAFADRPIRRDAIYWEHEANRAVRAGDWKLVAKGRDGPWELYNLEENRTETIDLAAKYPERVKELAAKWQAYAERCDVLPVYPRRQRTARQYSKKRVFELKTGAELTGADMPDVKNKLLTISATIETGGADGVILAHGGTSEGYSVFVHEGKLGMAVRRQGELTTVVADDKLPAGVVTVEARLRRNGAIRLMAGGKQVASGKAPGALSRVPTEGLNVGNDGASPVGDYRAPNAFKGKIRKLTLKVGK